jgi:hypothetical protein
LGAAIHHRVFPEQAWSLAGQVDGLYFFLVAVSAFFTVLIFALVFVFAVKYLLDLHGLGGLLSLRPIYDPATFDLRAMEPFLERDAAPWESRQFKVQACVGGGTDAAWRDLKLAGSPMEQSRKMKRPQAMSLRAGNENARELLAGERWIQSELVE